jgi:hypothetical protein
MMDDVRLCLIAKAAVEKIDHSTLRTIAIERSVNGEYSAELSALGYVPESVSKVDISSDTRTYAAFLLKSTGYVIQVLRDDGMTYFGF